MAFKPHYYETEPNHETTVVLAAASGETYTNGEALVINASGQATKCGATAKPTYIASSLEGSKVNAHKVRAEGVYEVPCQASTTGLVVGAKVTLHTDGLQITGTSTSGVATLVRTAEKDAMALVRFE